MLDLIWAPAPAAIDSPAPPARLAQKGENFPYLCRPSSARSSGRRPHESAVHTVSHDLPPSVRTLLSTHHPALPWSSRCTAIVPTTVRPHATIRSPAGEPVAARPHAAPLAQWMEGHRLRTAGGPPLQASLHAALCSPLSAPYGLFGTLREGDWEFIRGN
ncbi:hypothetical protein OsI_07235 [Oryza sativa Indica Group]|uniref:Uncharacterized protein n=1 Tax=Oryza sativa subsp. indica TaxID=39946 RepID=B8AHY0_ORYSI|nr:hypothetical protein OsI_07235 [Oryza sativa Indica Group]